MQVCAATLPTALPPAAVLIDRGPALQQALEEEGRAWAAPLGRALDAAGLATGQAVLLVGCANRALRSLLAERVGPAGRVLEAGPCGDAVEGPAADLVFAHRALLPARQPTGLLRALWRRVAPGGTLLLADIDTTGVRSFPQQAALERGFRLINDALRRQGRDLETGSRLPAMLLEAGLGAADGCLVEGLITPAAPASRMVRGVIAGLLPAIERAGLADLRTLTRLDHDLADSARGLHLARWPDLVCAWKHRPAQP